MTDYKKYINALRKCAEEHENDRTPFGNVIVSDLCRDTANLLESLEQESFINKPCVAEKQCGHDKNVVLDKIASEIEEIQTYDGIYVDRAYVLQIIDKYISEKE